MTCVAMLTGCGVAEFDTREGTKLAIAIGTIEICAAQPGEPGRLRHL